MPAPQVTGLPPFFTLESGYIVRVTALDASDGSTVSAVVVSNISLSVDTDDVGAEIASIPLSPALIPGGA